MKSVSLILLLISMISFVGCKNTSKKDEQEKKMETEQHNSKSDKSAEFEQIPDAAHNSRNSLDWAGNYHGVLPCADCLGIETTLELNDDLTYKIKLIYLDRDAELEGEGMFRWSEDGQKINLQPKDKEEPAMDFFVGENMLHQLDQDGNRITGELADKYILEKY